MTSKMLVLIACMFNTASFGQLIFSKPIQTALVIPKDISELPANFQPKSNEKVIFQKNGIFIYAQTKEKTSENKTYITVKLTRAINMTNAEKTLLFEGVSCGYDDDKKGLSPANPKEPVLKN